MKGTLVAGDLAVPRAEVLRIHVEPAALERRDRDLGRTDVAVQHDRVALSLERLPVQLAEDELLGEVLVADRDLRLAAPGKRRGARARRARAACGARVAAFAVLVACVADDSGAGIVVGSWLAAPQADSPAASSTAATGPRSLPGLCVTSSASRGRRTYTPAARRASAWAASSSPSASDSSGSVRSSEVWISQSANHAFLGNNGPWR